MKKLVFLTACVGVLGLVMPDTVWADKCPDKAVSFFGQSASDDEFIYNSWGSYSYCKDKKDTCSVSGFIFECDNDFCGHKYTIKAPAGAIWKGQNVGGTSFYCSTDGLNDSWVKLNSCTDSVYNNSYTADGAKNFDYGKGRVLKSKYVSTPCALSAEGEACAKARIKGMPAKMVNGKCSCGQLSWNGSTCVDTSSAQKGKCDGIKINRPGEWFGPSDPVTYKCAQSKYTKHIANADMCMSRCKTDGEFEHIVTSCIHPYDVKNGKECVKGDVPPVVPTPDPVVIPKPVVVPNPVVIPNPVVVPTPVVPTPDPERGHCSKTTWKQRTTENGKRCCDLPKKDGLYDSKTDTCNCTDTTKEFKIQDGKGMCVVKETNAEKIACEKAVATGAVWNGTACTCTNPALPVWNKVSCVQSEGQIKCSKVVGARWTGTDCVCDGQNMIPDYTLNKCVVDQAAIEAQEAAERAESRAKIIAAGKVLDSISDQFETSVWKNKDGGFNTARLASDGIAGVVLGTAGGLITSNVIKKNQIKSGFEDIKCTISGQTVADWGDDFQVGIGLNGNY